MDKKVVFQYEAAANASYLVASVGQEDFIRYEMKMLENNAIAHLLPAKKFQQDDLVQIHYNVTARMTLQQILTRQQMKKNEFLSLLQGVLSAYDELLEYQLSLSGLLLDEEHIFVKPGSFDPGFIYLPIHVEDSGLTSLRDFVMQMVTGSRIANTHDDFVQRLIALVNEPGLTLQQMHDEVRKLSAVKPAAPSIPEAPKGNPGPAVPVFHSGGQPVKRDAAPPVEQPPVAPPPVAHSPAPTPPHREPMSPVGTNKDHGEKPDKKPGKKPGTVKEKGSSSKESTIFVAVQAVFVLLAALLLKNGFFVQEGQINYSYIAGIAVLILGADFVLYRELFVNRKKKSAAAGKAGKPAGGKSGKLPKAPGAKTNAVKPPVAKQPAASPSVQDYAPQKPVAPVSPVNVTPVVSPEPSPVTPSPQPYYPPENSMDTESNTETVLMDEYGAGEGYLEYVENGLVKRIHLTNEVTVLGSRPQNVDHVLNSKRVSKVHAEFIRCGDQYSVRDINSTNGTYLNGGAQRIVSNQDFLLKNGDRVRLGDMELTFKC